MAIACCLASDAAMSARSYSRPIEHRFTDAAARRRDLGVAASWCAGWAGWVSGAGPRQLPPRARSAERQRRQAVLVFRQRATSRAGAEADRERASRRCRRAGDDACPNSWNTNSVRARAPHVSVVACGCPSLRPDSRAAAPRPCGRASARRALESSGAARRSGSDRFGEVVCEERRDVEELHRPR